jgi:hypothetical protein
VGVSLFQVIVIHFANPLNSITRLMGESFRLHSQALVGYEDDIEASSNISTPSMISQGVDDNDDSVY